MPGWTNEHLEALIRSSQSYIDAEAEESKRLYDWLLSLSDEESVEIARMAITNLAYRHAGFYETADSVSLEGMYHSLSRVMKLMGEAIKESSGY